MKHIISLVVENHQGVLSRIAGLFSGRGYNLESITSGPAIDPSVARITLVCNGEESVINQIKKQLHKIIDVIKVYEMTDSPSIDRELALIKVSVPAKRRGEVIQIADIFKAQVMDVSYNSMIIEITGPTEKIEDIISLLKDYTIVELARSGLVSMERGKKGKREQTRSV